MKISEGWMVSIIGATFFFVPVCISLAVVYGKTGAFGYTPGRAEVLAGLYNGVAGGLVALQGYLNKRMGEYERGKKLSADIQLPKPPEVKS